ncbi:hypothetical protein E8E15_001722 [Penicillium rubens]|nr:hypothetical protein E8E15_001722 [Penicillium rubens]
MKRIADIKAAGNVAGAGTDVETVAVMAPQARLYEDTAVEIEPTLYLAEFSGARAFDIV